MMRIDKLPPIKYGSIPNVLLVGNGINRTFAKQSWSDVLKDISTVELDERERKIVEQMPYPLQTVILTEDRVNEKMSEISERLLEANVELEQERIISGLIDLQFDAILTTNYTYEIEKSIDPKFYCKLKSSSKYRKTSFEGKKKEEQFGLFKYMKVSNEDGDKYVWHIHGEAARPNSMVIGHYYYGNLLSAMQQYIPQVIARYSKCNSKGIDFEPQSWIDYFLIGNVYIVGLGLDFSEIDLWWLINCKKRRGENGGKLFFFEPNLEKEDKIGIKMLSETYGMEVVTQEVNENYLEYYKQLPSTIKQVREE